MSGRKNDKQFQTMIKKHGSEENARNWYRQIGQRGGRASNHGGFASNKIGEDGLTGRERASVFGAVGGKKSKRGKARVNTM